MSTLPLQIVSEDEIAAADSLFRANLETKVETLAHMPWADRVRIIGNDLWHVGLKIVIAVAIVVVGRWVIKRLVRMVDRALQKWKVDHALRTFVRSATKTVFYFVLAYIVIAWLGINTSLFVALFAAAGLAVGMAMSGVFQNLAGGVAVLVLKPFKCGDWVELQGQAGTVMDIRLFDTRLRTVDNRTVLLPNSSVVTSVILNHTAARTRRLEWPVSLDLRSDFDAARKVIMELLHSEGRLNSFPAPEVVVSAITSDSVDLSIRGWVATDDYWPVYFAMSERIFKTLSANGFDMGTNQVITVIKSPDSPE